MNENVVQIAWNDTSSATQLKHKLFNSTDISFINYVFQMLMKQTVFFKNKIYTLLEKKGSGLRASYIMVPLKVLYRTLLTPEVLHSTKIGSI
jgi:hypothetical protein